MDGNLTIIRDNNDGIRVRVNDVLSGTQFLDVCLTPDALALALTGLAYQPCQFELRPQQVGKRREVKRERVFYTGQFQHGSPEEQQAKADALAPFEGDGWRGDARDLGNPYRGNSVHGYLVTFTQFVAPREEPWPCPRLT